MVEEKKLGLTARIKKWYRGLPDKKRYFELISAILAIPVLSTVLLLNLGNLRNEKEKPTPTPAAKNSVTVIPVTVDKEAPATPTSTPECKKEVGPVEISSPTEDQTVTQSPVCFNVEYNDNNYCSVVWRYRINNGSWSDYADKSVCLYNLTDGQHKFELNVKSVVSDDQTNLVRNFIYQGGGSTSTPTPTPTPTPTTILPQ